MIVTVDKPLSVLSNGVLVDTQAEDPATRTTYPLEDGPPHSSAT